MIRQIRTLAVGYGDAHHVHGHTHGWHQLLFARSGVMHVTTDDRVWVVPANRALWVPAGAEHALTMRGFVAMRTLYLPGPAPVRTPSRIGVVAVGELLRALIGRCVEIGLVDADADPTLGPLVDLVGFELRRAPALPLHLPLPADPRARRVADRLLADPADRRPLARLATTAGASPRTLERRFRAETGMTFGAWRTQLRLHASLHLLSAGLAVTEVALRVGYDSPSAYVAAFRRALGTTPGAYAKHGRLA